MFYPPSSVPPLVDYYWGPLNYEGKSLAGERLTCYPITLRRQK
jgi:hypothetical protein